MTRLPSSVLLVAFLGLLALSAGGIAFAYWRGSGSGHGAGTTGTTVAVTLSPATPAADLRPGGQASVVLTLSNSNAAAAHIGSLTLDTGRGTLGYDVDAGHAGCALSTLSFTAQTNAGAGWTVPGKVAAVDGSLPVTLTNALTMGPGAANACQGALFTVNLAAGP